MKRLYATIGETDKGKHEVIKPFSNNVEEHLEVYYDLATKEGKLKIKRGKGYQEKNYKHIWIADSRRPYKQMRF